MKKYIPQPKTIIFAVVTLALLALAWEGIQINQHLHLLRQRVDTQWNDAAAAYEQRSGVVGGFLQVVSSLPHLEQSAAANLGRAHQQVEQTRLDPQQAPTHTAQLKKFLYGKRG